MTRIDISVLAFRIFALQVAITGVQPLGMAVGVGIYGLRAGLPSGPAAAQFEFTLISHLISAVGFGAAAIVIWKMSTRLAVRVWSPELTRPITTAALDQPANAAAPAAAPSAASATVAPAIDPGHNDRTAWAIQVVGLVVVAWSLEPVLKSLIAVIWQVSQNSDLARYGIENALGSREFATRMTEVLGGGARAAIGLALVIWPARISAWLLRRRRARPAAEAAGPPQPQNGIDLKPNGRDHTTAGN